VNVRIYDAWGVRVIIREFSALKQFGHWLEGLAFTAGVC